MDLMMEDNLDAKIIQRIRDFDRGYSAAFHILYTWLSEEDVPREELLIILKEKKRPWKLRNGR
jgi:hypothetical protein